MASAKMYRMDGTEVGAIDVSDAVFGVAPNEALMHTVVVGLLRNQRQGNASTKLRREVRGGGVKPFRQKGTGNARRGSTREPLLRGGGRVWGPRPREYRREIPAELRRQALCCALSARLRDDALCVLESLVAEAPKTKPFAEMVRRLSPDGRKTLLVTAEHDRNVLLSARNLPKVAVKTAGDLNALDVLDARRVVLAAQAVRKLEERLS